MGRRAPPSTAMASGPAVSWTRRSPSAAAVSASFQLGLDELAALADHRGAEPVGVVGLLVAEPALVAQPPVVDRVAVDAEVTDEPVGRRLQRHPAADRARRAGGLDDVEVPRAGLEPVGRGGEGAHRADLDDVAAEVRVERPVGEDVDLGRVAPADEVDHGVARHLVGEAGAARALDAPLPVERHQRVDRDGLGPVPLLLDEAALAGAEGEGLVLERALATAVAHRAVEGMVDEEELEDAVLGLLDLGRVGDDLLAVGHGHEARRHEGEATGTLDLHQAHAAHAHRAHPGVPAEPGDVGAPPFGGGDDHLALLGLHDLAVDGDLDGFTGQTGTHLL